LGILRQMLSQQVPTTSTLVLGDLYAPHIFDAIKNSIDQAAFQSLFENHSSDPVMQCRRAELLIQLESDDEALALIQDNPSLLARGLKAKLMGLQNKLEEVEALCNVRYDGVDPLQREGMVLLLEANIWACYMRHDYETALRKCDQAELIAYDLGLSGRLKVIKSHREALNQKLGRTSTEILELSGNTVSQQYQLITRWRSLMLEGKFDDAANLELEPAIKKLAMATRYYKETSVHRAASMIVGAQPSVNEFKLYHCLLTLQIYVKISSSMYANPKEAIANLRKLTGLLANLPQLIENARTLYPLGVCLAATELDAFDSAARTVPILKHSKYRDGVYIDGQLVAVLPNEVRKALIYDRLNMGENSLAACSRKARFRAKKALEKIGLEYRHIVTQAELNRDRFRLNQS
jgi:hypothetical protein